MLDDDENDDDDQVKGSFNWCQFYTVFVILKTWEIKTLIAASLSVTHCIFLRFFRFHVQLMAVMLFGTFQSQHSQIWLIFKWFGTEIFWIYLLLDSKFWFFYLLFGFKFFLDLVNKLRNLNITDWWRECRFSLTFNSWWNMEQLLFLTSNNSEETLMATPATANTTIT